MLLYLGRLAKDLWRGDVGTVVYSLCGCGVAGGTFYGYLLLWKLGVVRDLLRRSC